MTGRFGCVNCTNHRADLRRAVRRAQEQMDAGVPVDHAALAAAQDRYKKYACKDGHR